MSRFRFTLEPLLEARRKVEEERRATLEQAQCAFREAARDRMILERLERRQREAWLVQKRRLETFEP